MGRRIEGDRIVVFHSGALGDFILACPVIEGLSAYLRKRVYFCTKYGHSKLVALKKYYDGLLPIDDPVLLPFYDHQGESCVNVPEFLEKADFVFVFGQRGSIEFAMRMEEISGIKCFWISSFPDSSSCEPVRIYLLKQLQRHGFKINIKPFRIKIPKELLRKYENGEERLQFKIVIHPGSGSIKKVWPYKGWVNLLDFLRSNFEDVDITVVLGPADYAIQSGFMAIKSKYNLKFLMEPDLLELAAKIKMADLYIGVDSGVSHLAASTGTETVVIFGPTNPEVWAPFGENVTVVMDNWKLDEILDFKFSPDHSKIPEKILDKLDSLFQSRGLPMPGITSGTLPKSTRCK